MKRSFTVAVTVLGLNTFISASAALSEESPSAPATAAAPQPLQPSPAQDQASAASITEEQFGRWALQCTSDKSMNPPCQIVYRLSSNDQQIATVISMAKASGGAVGMQMALPLGFAIQGGVKIAFGAKFSMTAAVSRCTVQGCLVEGVAPANLLTAMLKEKTGQITLRMLQGNDINLPVDLNGFSQAFKAMSAKS